MEGRRERGGTGKKGIYIYTIYRVGPLLSAGVVSMRQHALLLYAYAYNPHTHKRISIYMHIPVHAHIHIQVYSPMKAYTHTRMRICARMRTCMHQTHANVRAQTRMHSDTRGPGHVRTHALAHEHACMRTRTHKHTCTCARTWPCLFWAAWPDIILHAEVGLDLSAGWKAVCASTLMVSRALPWCCKEI